MALAQMRSTELAGLQRKTSAFVLTKQDHVTMPTQGSVIDV
jgi:hypothetical protein